MTKLVFIDTETNGLSPIKHQIIQLSAVTSVDSNEYIYDQYVMLSEGANITNSNIHNITIDVLNDNNALPFDVVFNQFKDWIQLYYGNDDDIYFVGHNVFTFDMRFIEVSCMRYSISIPQNWIFVDSLVQFRKYNSYLECDNFKLITLYNYLKDESTEIEGELHNSLTDCKILQYVYNKLTEDLSVKTKKNILNEGKRSITYDEVYLSKKIEDVIGLTLIQIENFNKRNIHKMADLIYKYRELIVNSTPINKRFYKFLELIHLSFEERRSLTSNIQYISNILNVN